ncbi:cation-dependent mannose-6-phosphate receptor-like [Tachypleus tridentatus]|uniref:cation-dependent mannose-6-phosphate receptor-like n=1 Tax=Tachypleus tridentatus TaxID=6853 RepID=UPI003FD4D1D7
MVEISIGSVLLIIFFVLLLVYLLIGMTFNYGKGARGVELIPNYEFWCELPAYVIEGWMFFCRLITCRPTRDNMYDSI